MKIPHTYGENYSAVEKTETSSYVTDAYEEKKTMNKYLLFGFSEFMSLTYH